MDPAICCSHYRAVMKHVVIFSPTVEKPQELNGENKTETKRAQMTRQHLSQVVSIPRSLEFLAPREYLGGHGTQCFLHDKNNA